MNTKMFLINYILNSGFQSPKVSFSVPKYQKVLSKALFVISTHNSYLGHDGYVDKTGNFFVFKLVNELTGIKDVLSGIAQRIETYFLPYLKINIDLFIQMKFGLGMEFF